MSDNFASIFSLYIRPQKSKNYAARFSSYLFFFFCCTIFVYFCPLRDSLPLKNQMSKVYIPREEEKKMLSKLSQNLSSAQFCYSIRTFSSPFFTLLKM